ncbi:excinuclease ABC subunit UvrC [Candidatus Phytoplasma asteris]|uniref:UvrABC system protein C n=2 Tax=16SrI (Aster yellows group) TaxID=3042590 RepID=UVRC_AYWBP|nr:excinuclease ABC subunit UvrC [Aster yellows witches'-broom phytoplasma]Q2NJ78.1 RecName: Full=UvrABC system protein C; Short=Protein UvrC; AltName: Full=Excinuclease ABC subunit C [Aster yellows witches'-broom phytoplasma AYWB]ABC65515.1 excinuclease ABC subunit C [Aster yellows witches'-broom phytoplasma AYWB]
MSILLEKIKTLPPNPGCYLFKNTKDTIIYVGKAKNLKKRVQSYFTKRNNLKTAMLIEETQDFFYIITNNEQEALILEANLIKTHTPKYNFKLLDDKTYPYIEITKEKHPQLKISRFKQIPPGKIIFGPYPNLKSTKETLKLLHLLYPLRRCQLASKKPCLHFHINQCLGACAGKTINYKPNIDAITKFLKGNIKDILKKLHHLMQKASEKMFYEKAQEYRDIIDSIKQTTKKQLISNQKLKNCDIFAYAFNQDQIAIQILKIRQGNIVDSYRSVFSYVGFVCENILTYLNCYYQKNIKPDIIITGKNQDENILQQTITNQTLLEQILQTKVNIYHKGDKKKLFLLALKNAQNDLSHNNLIYQSKDQKIQEALNKLAIIFNKDIKRIDVFDNSQLFGKAFVAARIVFNHFEFDKKLYRTFHIKGELPNEYQAFEETLTRCYNKGKEAENDATDLILVDGSLVQLRQSQKTLKKLGYEIPLGALQKNNKHQLTHLVTFQEKLMLEQDPNLFHFLKSLSEEVHRFAVSFHRKTKKKLDYKTTLSNIKGVGVVRKKAILNHFESLEAIKKATLQDFQKIGINQKLFLLIKKSL